MVVGPPKQGKGDSEPAAPNEGLSAFAARVLDQLSLSAWLPAALMTGAGTVLVQFRRQRSASVSDALTEITKDKVRLLVLVVPILILATLVTQAFSFEAIRTLEGYWRRRGPATALRTYLIRRQVSRKERLKKRRQRAAEKAFAVARPRLLRDRVPTPVVDALECKMLGVELPALTEQHARRAANMPWRGRCNAEDLARVDQLAQQEKDYPITSRVLPTRLGNVIRATEDTLQHAGNDLEGFALRWRATAPPRVQLQHDQFRTRLDMYCTLVFVSALLTALTPLLLVGRVRVLSIAAFSAGFLALTIASYSAAVSSARGYCTALKQMDALAL
jgi:hypothetical protein